MADRVTSNAVQVSADGIGNARVSSLGVQASQTVNISDTYGVITALAVQVSYSEITRPRRFGVAA